MWLKQSDTISSDDFSLPDGASAGNDIIMQSRHYFLLNLAVVKMASSENSLKSKRSRERPCLRHYDGSDAKL